MFDRILYAAEIGDGRPRSLALVADIALHHDAEVVVLRVGEVAEEQIALAKKLDPDLQGASETAEAEARVAGRVAAGDVAGALTEAGVFVRTIARSGRIAEEVLAAAEEIDADLIVVSSARRTALGALLTGNVTDEIVRRSVRPVLVVPQAEPHRREEPKDEKDKGGAPPAGGVA